MRAAGRVITTTDRANLSATKKAALDIQATVCSIMQNAAKPAIAATRAAAPDKAELDRIIAVVLGLIGLFFMVIKLDHIGDGSFFRAFCTPPRERPECAAYSRSLMPFMALLCLSRY